MGYEFLSHDKSAIVGSIFVFVFVFVFVVPVFVFDADSDAVSVRVRFVVLEGVGVADR